MYPERANEHAAATDPVDGQQADEGTDRADGVREDRAGRLGLHIEGLQHLRGVGEDGEVRGDDARPEDADEDGASQLTLAEELAVPVLADRLRGELLGLEELRTHVFLDDLTSLGLTAVTKQPAWGFGQTDPQAQHDESRNRRGRQDPLPRDPEPQQRVAQQNSDEETDTPTQLKEGQLRSTLPGRGEFRQHRGTDRVLGADGHAQQESEDGQGYPAGDEGLGDTNDDEGNDVDHEHLLAAELVGEVAEEWSADENTEQACGADQTFHRGGETQVMIDVQDDDADDTEVVMSSPPPNAVAAVTWRRKRLDSGEMRVDAISVLGIELVGSVLAAIVAAPSGGGQCTTRRYRADP